MKISYRRSWGGKEDTCTIPQLLEKACSAQADHGGQLENLSATHGHLLGIVGRLVGTLAARGLLSADEILDIADYYGAERGSATLHERASG